MMRAGKDYIASVPEYESKRPRRIVPKKRKPLSRSLTVSAVNQGKPTLKLKPSSELDPAS